MASLDAEEMDQQVLPFLSLKAEPPVRAVAMEYFLGLTGTTEGQKFIGSRTQYLTAIVSLLEDKQLAIAKDAFLALINLTSDADIAASLMGQAGLVNRLLKVALDDQTQHIDLACTVLSNLSRSKKCARDIIDLMADGPEDTSFDRLIATFCKENTATTKRHYLGPLLSNLTQIQKARHQVLDQTRCVVQRLLPYTEYSASVVRRGGVIGTLRNCCFETEHHEWLLGPQVDILPRLLLPLAGPEELDDSEQESLPEDLQYLEPDKKREPDPDIRKMLIEAVNQLCALKPCRQLIKDKNTYVILRELHKWEKDPAVLGALESLIQLLIADEPEPGMENLREVQIPPDIEDRLDKEKEAQDREIKEKLKDECQIKDSEETTTVAMEMEKS